VGEPLPYLRTALERLEQASLAPALASLLHAWRASDGAPAIADAIDRLSDTLTRNEPLIRGAGATSMREAWYAGLRSKRPAALGRLLESLPEGSDRTARLRVLLAEPPDPRIGTYARRWLDAPPSGRGRAAFLAALAKLIEHTGDVRLAETPSKRVPALGEEARTVLARIDAILRQPGRTESTTAETSELLAQIHADPDDDEPRAVLADLLQQHGDPRGLFIALQLARHGTAQGPTFEEKKLQRTWGRTWLGAMEPIVGKEGVVFERGFVARCRYASRERPGDAFEAPEWATVTEVDVSDATRSAAPFLLSAAARRFRHVLGMRVDEVPRLARARELAWETVGFAMRSWNQVRGLEEGPGRLFSAARTLVLRVRAFDALVAESDDLARMVAHWPSLRAVDVSLRGVSYLVPILDRIAAHVTSITVRSRAATAMLDRASGSLAIEMHVVNEYELAAIKSLFDAMSVARAELRVPEPGGFDGERIRLRDGVARIASLAEAARRRGIALTFTAS
jgi:uncharacterized protein (TIGR02996 family)